MRAVMFSYMKSHQLGSAHEDGTVAVWDTDKNSLFHKFEPIHTDSVSSITFSPVNHMLMGSAGLDKQVIFYDIHKN